MKTDLSCSCGCKENNVMVAKLEPHRHVIPKKHNQLENLDYSNSGHTGFAGIVSNTTEYWENHADYIPVDSMLVVYTDYKETGETHTPGLKIGDGVHKVGELAFVAGGSGGETPIDNLTIRLNESDELSVNPLLTGGYIVVSNNTERDNIPAALLKIGTHVYNSTAKTNYRWNGVN